MNTPPMLNGRPTQAPLNREQQKTAFENLKSQYFQQPPPVPTMPIQAIKEYKLSETEQLRAMQVQMQERGMKEQIEKVKDEIHEKKLEENIKTFYCHHVFQTVKAKWGILPVKYKICSKCGLVK